MTGGRIDPDVVGGEPPRGFHLDIRAHGFSMTDALREYATEHVAAKLGKHARAVQSVVIRFSDVNGTKGGEDKRCEVEVLVRRTRNPLVVAVVHHDLRAAIDGAADRIQKALARELDRKRKLPRQRARKAVPARKTLH